MKLIEQIKRITTTRGPQKMSVISLSKFNDKENGLRSEFERKYEENEVSGSTEKLNEFKFLTILGQGAFGVVKLVKHEPTDKYYAVKILRKDKIIKSKQLNHTMNEKKVLRSLKFQFVVRLEFSLKDNSFLYMGMGFVNGGELFTVLRKAKKFSENQARFYATQVVLAIEYIHKLGLVYRDLKPENILLDCRGFIKITDFGFCKPIKDRTYTLCGTPEYIAPEIVQNKGYGQSVDWWSFGILIYEFVAGFSPFSAGDPDQMQMMEKIVAGKYKIPSSFSGDMKNIVQNLLQGDLTKRYGNLKNGVDDIKNHAWFKPINWLAVYSQKVQPPYIPKVSGPGDYSQFDKYDEIKLSVANIDKYEKEFADF